MNKITSIFALSLFVAACGSSDDDPVPVVVDDSVKFELTFADANSPWTVGYADYPGDAEDIYKLSSEVGPLPAPLQQQRGLNIKGTNRSDDLFMFAERQITGLDKNQAYEADITLTFATNVPSGCFGVGGSPGESVYIKAGIEEQQPKAEIGGAGYYQMNIDKGNQSVPGKRVKLLGDFANSQECDNPQSPYELKTVKTDAPIEFTSTDDGSAWAIVATDSGFESETSIWYTAMDIEVRKK
ncbi:hypothetical protein CHH28_16505 [Bacterioplanes sanyensis]|uniref:Lipoprotein n=1 Tax=Bacterioplanes sanyensis TaxID=1249553 RepID=A0A222FMD0_9GAMM|nr:hypothetical protein [Bacterioplanes sanyensis]ASP40178.1 hypothetical protein CHH28_16505 [Bacterioplanes sanyensis]